MRAPKGPVFFGGYMQCAYPISLVKDYQNFTVPCGKCMPCRLNKQREWKKRLLDESYYWYNKTFLTLTYDEENLPENGTLVKKDYQDFMKRIRKLSDRKMVYYACGEYGDLNGRPHYHAILYGLSPLENYLLEDTWKKGRFSLDPVSPQTCGYVAGYVTKKLGGILGHQEYYQTNRIPPFQLQSQGIGLRWAIDNRQEMEKKGYVTMMGKKMPIPKYYKEKLDLDIDIKVEMSVLLENAIENEKFVKGGHDYKELAKYRSSQKKQKHKTLLKKSELLQRKKI
jgi:hypothetical protein